MYSSQTGVQPTAGEKISWRKPSVEVHNIAHITAGTTGSCNDAGFRSGPLNNGGNCPPSDIRLKRGVAEVGATSNGLKLYSYRYKWSEETFIGVMAQEVLEVKPEAVITREDGFYAVDYDMLGLTMISLDKWRETKRIHEACSLSQARTGIATSCGKSVLSAL